MANLHGSIEPVAWAVYWGLPPTRKNSVHFDKESAQAVANQIKSATEVRPLYAAPAAQQPQAEKHATMAGLESSINILSSLVDEQRQLLAEVDAVFGVDAHGIVLEDGDSALIDRVRAHLAATSEAKQPQAEAVPSNCRERLRSEGKPYPRSTCAVCGNLSPNWKKCNASIAAMKQGNQP